MSTSLYLRLTDYNNKSLTSTGQSDGNLVVVSNSIDPDNAQFLKVISYSADVVQTLNIGAQSSGAGAGRITFNPMSVSRVIDAASPLLFQAAASGTPFKTAELFVVNEINMVLVKYVYKLAAVKTVTWRTDTDDSMVLEMVTFEYGGLIVSVNQQTADGKITQGTPIGWNRIKNVKDNDSTTLIQ